MNHFLPALQLKRFCVVLIAFFVIGDMQAQVVCTDRSCPPQPLQPWCYVKDPMRHCKKASVAIPGTSKINGYLEYLPAGYNPANKYALIVYWHGIGGIGPGTSSSLCCFMEALPLRIEEGRFYDQLSYGGQPYQFIELAPQAAAQDYSAADMDAFLEYVKTVYSIDPSRIYFTGISFGANQIMNYIGSNVNYANKIAAAVTVGMCTASNYAQAGIIAQGDVAYWGIQCVNDDYCGGTLPVGWANDINAQATASTPSAVYTLTPTYNPGFPHDIWYVVYDSSYRAPNTNMSVQQWMLQFSKAAALPVSLKNYSVSISNQKVLVKWTTSTEVNSQQFIVERAGADNKFTEIGRVQAAGNTSRETNYSFVDDQPLPGISYYRLSQTDANGSRKSFNAIRVNNGSAKGTALVIAPNPVTSQLKLQFTLQSKQRVQIHVSDLSGRVLLQSAGDFVPGVISNSLTVGHLPKGTYLVTVACDEFTETRKIVKQ